MLKRLRNKRTQKRIFIFLAVTIIPPFIFWGVITGRGEKTPSSLGVLDGRNVSVKEYLGAYNAVRRQAVILFGDNFAEAEPSVNLKGQAWDRLLLLSYAKKKRIRAGDSEVVAWIARQPLFQNRGRFDAEFYKRYVERALRLGTREFEEEIREALTISKIHGEIRSKVAAAEKDPKVIDEKTDQETQALMESLRKNLVLNVEAMREIFQEEA